MQPLDINRTITTIPDPLTVRRRSDMHLFIVICITMLSLIPLLVIGGITISLSFVLGGLAALTIAALAIRWPVIGFYTVAGCAVLVEQFQLGGVFLTSDLNVFYWPPNLEGLIERPIGFFFLFILLVLICHRLIAHQRVLQGGELLLPFLFYLLCVAGGVVHGLTSGGGLKVIVVEVRPFWYLFVSYLLAYNLVTHKQHIRTFFWVVILGAGVKAVQGVYIYLILFKGDLTNHREIMSHEESFFFVALLLLLLLFCIHSRYRPQLYAALLILPCLLVALIANQRRADYIALIVGAVVAWTLVAIVKPRVRKRLLFSLFVCLVLGVGYVAAFAHFGGVFGEPARAIVSTFQPDEHDADSNAYRVIENYDLKYTAQQNPLLGFGFGKAFLEPIPLRDISAIDPNYLYIPHNTIYWVWMRLGPLGFFALWYLLGSIIVRGSLIARQLRDPYLQLVAIYIVGATFMEIIVAYADYQLFAFRNVIYLGLLAGMLMKLPALDEKKEVLAPEPASGIPLLPISIEGERDIQLLATENMCKKRTNQ